MNLTDGSIHCGRRNFDGSGGNNHAVDHYEETKYPLVTKQFSITNALQEKVNFTVIYNHEKFTITQQAVKLGTITSDGKADVFSYAEDNMVLDPYLKKHLAHFGMNNIYNNI